MFTLNITGGVQPNEIDRISITKSSVLIIQQNDSGLHDLKIFSMGGWRKITLLDARANQTAYGMRVRNWLDKYEAKLSETVISEIEFQRFTYRAVQTSSGVICQRRRFADRNFYDFPHFQQFLHDNQFKNWVDESGLQADKK